MDTPTLSRVVYEFVLKCGAFDLRLLTRSGLASFLPDAKPKELSEYLTELAKNTLSNPCSPELWWEGFSLWNQILAHHSTNGHKLLLRLTAYSVHIRWQVAHYDNWIAYDREFRSHYNIFDLSSPLIEAAWSSPAASVQFLRFCNTARLPFLTAVAASPAAIAKKAAPMKNRACYAWNNNNCPHGDGHGPSDPAACAYKHMCRKCYKDDHKWRSSACAKEAKEPPKPSTGRDTRRSPSTSASGAKRYKRTCEYPSPLIALPSPEQVCSFNISNLHKHSKFMEGTDLRDNVLFGLANGFCLRFDGSPLKPAHKNCPSALANPSVVEAMLAKEVHLGAMAGPFSTPPLEDLQISRFSLLEKPDNKGFRFLFDLSFPENWSVNDGISREDAAVSYCRVSEICEKILDIGRGALLCKFDIARAYRHVPVCPADRRLLGMKWNNLFYIDLALPFGGRSCCSIFNEVGDFLTAIFNHESLFLDFDHYLDDFLGIGDTRDIHSSFRISDDFTHILELCEILGIPLADKTVFPTTRLTFLGFVLDTIDLTISLPDEKRYAYIAEIVNLKGKRAFKKKDLESLLGKLLHASTVIPIGRAFLRSLINKSTRAHFASSWVNLSKEERLNLDWWVALLSHWSGISLMRFCKWETLVDFELSSDAALTKGFGIVNGNDWVSGIWPGNAPSNIAVLELIPIVLAAILWGDSWSGKCILFHTDSMAAHFSAQSLLPSDPHLSSLIRELAIISVEKDFQFQTKHLPGKLNILADLLSRDRHTEFFLEHPSANRLPFSADIDSHVTRLISLCS